MRAPPYLLVQSREPGDPMREHEVACFRAALRAGPSDLAIVDALDRVPSRAELRGCRGVLLGGSGDSSSLDPFPWIGRLVAWLRDDLLPSDVPAFGSCFGLQVLTLALGGRMLRDPARREVGSVDVRAAPAAAADPVFGGLPSPFVAQAGHVDRAAATPPGADLLASTDRCPVSAFRVRGAPVWATQFHPELDADGVAVRWLRYAEKYPPPDLPPGTPARDAPFLRTLRASPEASALLGRFASLCAARAPGGVAGQPRENSSR